MRSIAWEKGYYSQEREDGSPDHDTIEENFAKTIDNDCPLILRSIEAQHGREVVLSGAQCGLLAYFVGVSLTRVPSFRDGVQELKAKAVRLVMDAVIDAGKVPPPPPGIDPRDLSVLVKPWASLREMVEFAGNISESLLKKRWEFCVPPPSVPLVTSDNPVVFSGKAGGVPGASPSHPRAEVVMNLRKDLALVCTPMAGLPHMMARNLSPFAARRLNRGVVRAARHRVFASRFEHGFDEFVKKYEATERRLVAG
jgi:hypothetical protein